MTSTKVSLLNLRGWPREGIQENPLNLFVFSFLSIFLFIFIFSGELIFSEDPLVKGPNHTLTTPHCLECLKVRGSYKQLAHKLCRDLRPISHDRDKLCPILFNTQVVQEVKDGCVCDSCGWPVCNQECAAGPNHQIECKVRVRHVQRQRQRQKQRLMPTKTKIVTEVCRRALPSD